MEYKLIVCGGTFDRLHAGHKNFLEFAFSKSEKVIVGLTSDEYVKKYKQNRNIQSFQTRKENLISFLKSKNLFERSEIVEIENIEGPLVSDRFPVEAIAVTEDTFPNAQRINIERKQAGFPELTVLRIPLTKVLDIPISSSGIRAGNMDIKGDLVLPQDYRIMLKEPLGDVISDLSNVKSISSDKIIAVGDETTKIFNQNLINQKVSIVDFVVNRERKYEKITDLGFEGTEKVFEILNPAGSITLSLWETIKLLVSMLSTQGRFIIHITGEEDLSVLPLVICFPMGYHIFYGQPGTGIVDVEVNEEKKAKIQEIISKFKLTTLGS